MVETVDIKGDAGPEIGVDELDKKQRILNQQGSCSVLGRILRDAYRVTLLAMGNGFCEALGGIGYWYTFAYGSSTTI